MRLVSFRGAETGAEIWVNPDKVNAVAEVDADLARRFPESAGGSVIVVNNQSITVRDKAADVVKALLATNSTARLADIQTSE